MEEFLQQKPISFERVEMNWYETANERERENDTEPSIPKDIPLEPSAADAVASADAAASGSSGIARVLDTLVEAASVEPKWEPPSDDEIADKKGTLRPGFDRHKDDGGWASRTELRSRGYGKGDRPRGGGPRTKWMIKWHRLKKQGMTWADFVKKNLEPPRSAASFS